MPTCPCCNHTWVQTRKKKEPKETDPRVTELIKFYAESFKKRYHAEPSVKWGACGTVAKRLLASEYEYPLEDIIIEYLECNDQFFRDTGYNFLLLPNYIQKRAVLNKKKSVML